MSNIIKGIAYLLILIAIVFEIKDLIQDKSSEKHRDVVSILILVMNIILIHFTTIK